MHLLFSPYVLDLDVVLQNLLFLSGLPPKILRAFFYFLHWYNVSLSFHLPSCDHLDCVWRVYITIFLIILFYPFPSHFLSLWARYTPAATTRVFPLA